MYSTAYKLLNSFLNASNGQCLTISLARISGLGAGLNNVGLRACEGGVGARPPWSSTHCQ